MVKGPPTTRPTSTAIPSSIPSNAHTAKHKCTYGGPCGKHPKKKRETLPLSKEPDAGQTVSARATW